MVRRSWLFTSSSMLWKPSIFSPISTKFKSLWMQLSTVDQGKMTRIGSAGVARRQAVDISPLRHVNHAICLLTTGGARESSFRNIKTIYECLADELSNSHNGSSNSYAIKKKNEIERVALNTAMMIWLLYAFSSCAALVTFLESIRKEISKGIEKFI